MKHTALSLSLAAVLSTAPVLSFAASLPVSAEDSTVYARSVINLSTDEATGWISWNADAQYPSHRANVLTPDFYVFAGAVDESQAAQIAADLGIESVLKSSGGKITFISPIEGESYSQADLDAYNAVIQNTPINNIKMIGLNAGADFLTNIAAPQVNYAAGMMIVGGTMTTAAKTGEAIPVYLSSPDAASVAYFQAANAKDNPYKELQVTIVHEGQESLAEAFANAWDQVFENNYRSTNNVTEFYNAPAMLAKGKNILEFKYDITPAPVFAKLGVTYHEKLHQSVAGMPGSDYAWFEYIPNSVLQAEKGTVPLIVSIHGNQNDPRLQGDSSGWVELAAKEGFMVVSPEYQTAEENAYFTQPGNKHIYGTVDGLAAEGIMKLVAQLQETYPQIDTSRIYVTGLSQGGAMTSYLGVAYSDVFAAAASVSGVNVFRNRIADTMKNYKGPEVGYLYLCGDRDFFQMIPVDGTSKHGTTELYGGPIWEKGTATDIYSIFNAYQQANHLEVTEMDMSLNPWYGIALENWHPERLGDRSMEVGTLSNDKGVVMQLTAIHNQAHWNYKPQAEYIWNFFKNYHRDPNTNELIITSTKNPSGWQKNANGSWSWLENGQKVTGWRNVSGTWYYMDANGNMTSSQWIQHKGLWYYTDAAGAMKKSSWLKQGDTWYYLNAEGSMAASTTVDGYKLDASGKWVK